jgi:hypothetical protein
MAVTGLVLASVARSDQLLTLKVSEPTVPGVRVAEVLRGKQALIRLRSKTGSQRARAETAAEALLEAAVAEFAPPLLSVATLENGEAEVRARGRAIVTADQETAKLAATTPQALAAGWVRAIQLALKDPYLALSGDGSLVVPVGESRHVRYGGPLGKALRVESAAASIATLKVDAAAHKIVIHGLAPGPATGILRAGRLEVPLAIRAMNWAAVIRPSASATLTGTRHSEELARKVAINAALCNVTPQPGADVSVASVEGADPSFSVTVAANGPNCLEIRKPVAVAVRRGAAPGIQPVDVLVSNLPERIPSRGCLMREQIDASRPVRLLYHHVNSSDEALLFVVRVVNTSHQCGTAHVALGEAGPNSDELMTGHTAAKRYWEQMLAGSGYHLTVPPGYASDIVRTPVANGEIVSGLGTITPLSPTPLYLEIRAEFVQAPGRWLELAPDKLSESPKLTNFRFGARKAVEVEHQIGGKWTFITIGRDGSVSQGGVQLAGDYGVLHEIDLGLVNPNPTPGQAEIVVRASGGLMRGLFLIDDVLHETGILRGFNEEVLTKEQVGPNEGRIIRIQTIPESASNYPIHIVVRSTA